MPLCCIEFSLHAVPRIVFTCSAYACSRMKEDETKHDMQMSHSARYSVSKTLRSSLRVQRDILSMCPKRDRG
jgi:hypothetical protein